MDIIVDRGRLGLQFERDLVCLVQRQSYDVIIKDLNAQDARLRSPNAYIQRLKPLRQESNKRIAHRPRYTQLNRPSS
jgi:hypothetical protein